MLHEDLRNVQGRLKILLLTDQLVRYLPGIHQAQGVDDHSHPEGDELESADGADVFFALQVKITLEAPTEKIIERLLLFAGEQELDAGSAFQGFVKREIGLAKLIEVVVQAGGRVGGKDVRPYRLHVH